jgi:hypothetical protein
MKQIYSCLLILFFFISCTTENEQQVAPAGKNDVHYMQRLANELPLNSKNSFDVAGELYNELLDSYYANNGTAVNNTPNILSQVNAFAGSNERFLMAKGSSYTPSSPSTIQYIITNPITGVPEIVGKSGMSVIAKLSFNTFLLDLKSRCKNDEDFEHIYDFIVSYEDNVTASIVLNNTEKQTILTSTSFARFSAYRGKRKPKKNTDRDWDLLIAGIAAGTDGMAQYSTGNAITMSTTVTIALEQ